MAVKKTKLNTKPCKPIRMKFELKESIFRQSCYFFLGYSSAEYHKWEAVQSGEPVKIPLAQDEQYDKNFNGFSTHYVDKTTGVRNWVIVIPHFSMAIGVNATLLHEIVHCIIKMYDFNNIPVTIETQEFFAFSVGNMWEEVLMKTAPKS